MNNLLSFGLPTYNRSAFVKEALSYYYDVLKMDDFQLVVSDNHSDDNTEEIVREFMSEHSNLVYFRQEENIGADRNMLFLQDNAQTDYFILLGDGVRLCPDKLQKIISLLKTYEYDAVMFNYNNRCRIKSQVYTDKNKLLAEVGWYVTQMSAYVISKKIIQNTMVDRLLYVDCEFNYYARMFRAFAKSEMKVYWMQDNCMTFSKIEKKNSWHTRLMTVWFREFVSTVISLPPNYTIESKMACIKEAGRYPIFNGLQMLCHIKENIMNKKNIVEYKDNIDLMMRHSWKYYYMLATLPKWIIDTLIFSVKVMIKIKQVILNEH